MIANHIGATGWMWLAVTRVLELANQAQKRKNNGPCDQPEYPKWVVETLRLNVGRIRELGSNEVTRPPGTVFLPSDPSCGQRLHPHRQPCHPREGGDT
jgi:hypothetical protein